MPPWGPAAGPPVGRDARVRARVRVRAKATAWVRGKTQSDGQGGSRVDDGNQG